MPQHIVYNQSFHHLTHFTVIVHIPQEGPTAYIVNTDPHDEPGRHWIAIWTEGNVSEIMDSYGLSLEVYGTTDPLLEWLNRHFKYQLHNGQSLQSLFSQSCGDYALMYLIDRAEGRSMQQFLNRFKKKDYSSRQSVARDCPVKDLSQFWMRSC